MSGMVRAPPRHGSDIPQYPAALFRPGSLDLFCLLVREQQLGPESVSDATAEVVTLQFP